MFSKKSDVVSISELEVLFKQLYLRLCDFANHLLKDGELAEDIVQDAFATYIERRENLSKDTNAIKSFLYTSIKNSCLNKIRHNKVVERYNKNNPFEIYSDAKILERIVDAEIIAEIHNAINKLPKGCALIIRSGYLMGLSNGEIADLMNISINTVKSQKKRGLELMKLHLGKAALGYFIAILAHHNFLK